MAVRKDRRPAAHIEKMARKKAARAAGEQTGRLTPGGQFTPTNWRHSKPSKNDSPVYRKQVAA